MCIVTSEISSALGLVGLAFLPELLPDPFMGIIISVIVYAVGSGLIEVLCSPIMEACPFKNKEATMSLLHSFYCWGSVGTIAVSTLFFAVFGMDSWKWLAVLWAIVPAVNVYNFATCPIEHLVDEGEGMKIRELFRKPVFWIAVCLMVCSGHQSCPCPSGHLPMQRRHLDCPRPLETWPVPACLPLRWESAV